MRVFDAAEVVIHVAKAILEQRAYVMLRLKTGLGLSNLQDQRPRTMIEPRGSTERCCVETSRCERL